ncbi:ribonuclease H-like domain-containing protein, partial [Russula dissimulans]
YHLQIRASSTRRDNFDNILKSLGVPSLMLIRDVDTRWSSTFLMIERALTLQHAIDQYLAEYDLDNQFHDIDWSRLSTMKEILQLPHLYQQILSSKKTPTICKVLPAFQGVLTKLKEYQRDHGYEFFAVLQSGIDKLEEYQQEIESIPTYTLAICKL